MGRPIHWTSSQIWVFQPSFKNSSHIRPLACFCRKHRQWYLMEASRPIWSWIPNQTSTHEKKRDTATSKSTLAILPQVWAIPQRRFWKPPSGADQYLTSLVRPLEPQYLSRFGQSNDPIQSRLRNRRKSSEWPYRLPMASTLMTQTKMQPPKLPPPTKILQWKQVQLRPRSWHRTPIPHHLRALPLPSNLFQIPPFVSSNLQIRHVVMDPSLFVRGRTLKTKNWSISRMTPNLALHGNRLVRGYVVILKRANCAGPFSNKCPTNTVRISPLMSRRQRTKSLRKEKEKRVAVLSFTLPFHLISMSPFLVLLMGCLFPTSVWIFSVIMAYSSNYVRVAPDRSRSRDDPPMWSNPHPARQRNPQYRDSWHDVPPLRQLRRVLIIVNLEQIRSLMNAHHCDAMEATTCRELSSLGRLEEYALFTLGPPGPNSDFAVDILLYYISQHITYTWDCYLEPSSMDLRWQDSTGDTFVLRNGQILIDLLREHLLIGLKAKNLASCRL